MQIQRDPWRGRRRGDGVDPVVLQASTGTDRRRQGRGRRVAARWCFPTPLRTVDRRPRVVSRVWRRTTNLVLCACSPLLLFICGAARRGPTNHRSVGRPRSGRDPEGKGPSRWAGPEINLTFSPLISTVLSRFVNSPHHKSVY